MFGQSCPLHAPPGPGCCHITGGSMGAKPSGRKSQRRGGVHRNQCWHHKRECWDPHLTPPRFCPTNRVHLNTARSGKRSILRIREQTERGLAGSGCAREPPINRAAAFSAAAAARLKPTSGRFQEHHTPNHCHRRGRGLEHTSKSPQHLLPEAGVEAAKYPTAIPHHWDPPRYGQKGIV